MAIPIMVNGNRIKRLREQKGWTTKELALALKLSEPEIYRAETGARGLSSVAVQRLKMWADEVEKKITIDPIQLARQEMAAMREEILQEIMGAKKEEKPPEEKQPSTFGGKLKELRERKGISKNKLSQILGVTPSTIRLWEENVSYPGPKNLKKISAFYNVKLATLKKEGKREVTVLLSHKDHDTLVAICKEQGVTPSEMVTKMIKRYK